MYYNIDFKLNFQFITYSRAYCENLVIFHHRIEFQVFFCLATQTQPLPLFDFFSHLPENQWLILLNLKLTLRLALISKGK